MGKIDNTKRLEFLAEKFDVFECDTEDNIKDKVDELMGSGCTDVQNVKGINSDTIALVCTTETKKVDNKGNEIVKVKKSISVPFDVFHSMVQSDPTNNKQHTQWMLETFTRLLKDSTNHDEAIRFVEEDLPLAEVYLVIFEKNKKKKKFKELCESSYVLNGEITNPTNINQYKSLAQLYDAVDPFIERDPSDMEKHMQRFVDAGQALIPVRDRKFTIFIPLTVDANVLFDKFASWCTCKPGNGMFSNYTEGKHNLKPNGEKSNIYIVIDHRFYDGKLEDNYLYQIHFESKQVRNRKQNGNGNFFEDVILKSEGVANFFHEELTTMAKQCNSITNNKYIDFLIKFGWTEALFDIMDECTPIIKFKDREVPRLPNISKFKDLHTLIIANTKLSELHSSIGDLTNMKEMIIPNNKLVELPKEIGGLKNLLFINILGNNIKYIPDEIKYLDETNGGSLYRIACNPSDIGVENYRKLKELLPSVKM